MCCGNEQLPQFGNPAPFRVQPHCRRVFLQPNCCQVFSASPSALVFCSPPPILQSHKEWREGRTETGERCPPQSPLPQEKLVNAHELEDEGERAQRSSLSSFCPVLQASHSLSFHSSQEFWFFPFHLSLIVSVPNLPVLSSHCCSPCMLSLHSGGRGLPLLPNTAQSLWSDPTFKGDPKDLGALPHSFFLPGLPWPWGVAGRGPLKPSLGARCPEVDLQRRAIRTASLGALSSTPADQTCAIISFPRYVAGPWPGVSAARCEVRSNCPSTSYLERVLIHNDIALVPRMA